ncbi:MAG TPA: exopolysaccharide biosynthesis polyprenyl glycosylphosphotransferase [Bryobacteraceae bacterium]|nr:exopolysaccharide biosynthesis polyprenyl glycosylphosphotransferase [Bryobacteraceae bacterium]
MPIAAAEQVVAVPLRQSSWATLWLVLIDVVALEMALFLGCLVRLALRPLLPITLARPQFEGLAIGVLILPIVFYGIGLYPGYGLGAVQRVRSRAYSTVTVFGVLLTWNYIFEERQWSRGVLLITVLFALTIPPALEALFRKMLIRRGICGEPVIILGAGRTGSLVARKLKKEYDLGLVPVGLLDDDPDKWGTLIDGIPVAGPLSAVSAFQGRAKVVLIAIPGMERQRLSELVQTLSFPSVIIIPDLFGIQSLWITSRDLGGVLGLEVQKNLLLPSSRLLKRVLDYSIALPLFLFAVPLIAVFAIWIKLQSPGPAFFRQQREGKNGNPLTVCKLRTMYPDAERLLYEHLDSYPGEKESWHQYYKLKKDPRVIPGAGAFLRRYSLDELPQLWNVLRGDMSLVGPRPFPHYHLEHFPPAFRALRASVMPGITGFWQVSERSDGNLVIQEAEDTYYIRNWSVWLDIYILFKTVTKLLAPTGAY